MEDIQIVTLFWNRDESAIKEVDLKYHNLCYGIAWNLLSNNEDSEECVNDTWFATWKYIPPKRPLKLPPFLGKITRGFAVDMLRKKYAAKRTDMHVVDVVNEVSGLNTTVVRSLDEHMEMQELVKIINDFLVDLSAKDRDIFIQRYWLMYPLKEIAIRHKTSAGAIKQNLFRSRNRLQKVLEREGHL